MPQQRPLALTDESMRDLFRYAGCLHPDDRGPFIERVAEKLRDVMPPRSRKRIALDRQCSSDEAALERMGLTRKGSP